MQFSKFQCIVHFFSLKFYCCGIYIDRGFMLPHSVFHHTDQIVDNKNLHIILTCPAKYVRNSGDCALSRMEPGSATDKVKLRPTETYEYNKQKNRKFLS